MLKEEINNIYKSYNKIQRRDDYFDETLLTQQRTWGGGRKLMAQKKKLHGSRAGIGRCIKLIPHS